MSKSGNIWMPIVDFMELWILPDDPNIWDLRIIWWVFWKSLDTWVLCWCNVTNWEIAIVISCVWKKVMVLCLQAWENMSCCGFRRDDNGDLVAITHCPNTIPTVPPQNTEKKVP